MTVQYSVGPIGGAKTTGGQDSLRSSRWLLAAFVAMMLVLTFLTARDGLNNLYFRWTSEEEYGYGFLTVALVPFFIWKRWAQLRALTNDNKWPGLALLIAAQLFAIVGSLGESYLAGQIALIVTLLALGMLVFGSTSFRVFAPLAVLMLLTLPLPYTLQAMLTIKLQLLSTDIGVAIVRLIGVPIFAEGNVIDLGLYKLQVAEACSGLRYLLPLICISFLLAYIYKAPMWKRALVVLSAAPITVLINSFRIAVVAVLVDNFGPQDADGFLHQFEGWIVFLVGALLLAFEILALERFKVAHFNDKLAIDGPAEALPQGKPVTLSTSAVSALVAAAVALGAIVAIGHANENLIRPSRENFVSFPRQLANWSGREQSLDNDVINTLRATDTYNGDFVSPTAGKIPVNFFVAYYDALNKSGAIHSPRVCLPGGGWEFAAFEERPFSELSSGMDGSYNRIIIQKGEQKSLVYYWFQQRERQTASEFGMKYFLLLDGINRGRKDGALVRLFTPIADNTAVALTAADDRLRDFGKVVVPQLPKYLPR
jgi:exosortase D (VPLPA-CTERM-specific)